MTKYRKKPVVIEAVQLLWTTWNEMCDFVGVGKLSDGKPQGCYVDEDGKTTLDNSKRIGLHIPTLAGWMLVVEKDWIIKGVNGEFYPCKPDIFEKTYEPVAEAELKEGI